MAFLLQKTGCGWVMLNEVLSNCGLYQRKETWSRTRYFNITTIARVFGKKIATSLPRMHAFTGYDLVIFVGKGRMIAYKLMKDLSLYQGTFGLLGS